MTCTQMAQETAKDAVQIYGGRGMFTRFSIMIAIIILRVTSAAITQTGMGRFVEHYHRTITFDSLLGGGEYFSLGRNMCVNVC